MNIDLNQRDKVYDCIKKLLRELCATLCGLRGSTKNLTTKNTEFFTEKDKVYDY